MIDKQLQDMNRRDLLELLLDRTKYIEELESRLNQMEILLKQKDAVIADKRINIEKAGSIAEAALQLNNVFGAAQAAAEQYLSNIQTYSQRCDLMIENTKKRCAAMEKLAADRVAGLKAEVEKLQFDFMNTIDDKKDTQNEN